MNRLFVCLIVGALLCLVGWTANAELTSSTPPPQKWDYEAFDAYPLGVSARLNHLGSQGWELVATTCPKETAPCSYYLKRPR